MADRVLDTCVLDANVLVAWIDAADSLHSRATVLLEQLERQGAKLCVVDVAVSEAVSVLCRRLRERKQVSELPAALAKLKAWIPPTAITWIAAEVERLYGVVFDLISETEGRLNFNDALLVLLHREGRLGPLATFDTAFAGVDGLNLIAVDEAAPQET